MVFMQAFCAVTPVPRQEDFGVFDAVATLLRREDGMLYAEDSFLVQFKSRTVSSLEYVGEKFRALLEQDLPLFIAQVDLPSTEIALHCAGGALTQPHLNNANGVVLHFDDQPRDKSGDVVQLNLAKPALRWNAADLADPDFAAKAYTVIKKWLELDRWNRKFRKIGMQRAISWNTNEIPSPGTVSTMWSPDAAADTLLELVPAIQLFAFLAITERALSRPVQEIMTWMRKHGVEADPTGTLRLMSMLTGGKDRLMLSLHKHPLADYALLFEAVSGNAEKCQFWAQFANRSGRSTSEKHVGTVETIQELGFVIGFDATTNSANEIGIRKSWLDKRNCELIHNDNGVFLLRQNRATTSAD